MFKHRRNGNNKNAKVKAWKEFSRSIRASDEVLEGEPERIRFRIAEELEAGYKAMAADEDYQKEAAEWCNGLINGVNDETRRNPVSQF